MKVLLNFTFALLTFIAVGAVKASQLEPGTQFPLGAIDHCNNGHIAVTFDDGPTHFTRGIIDMLVKYKQHATFFVNVNNYGKWPKTFIRRKTEEWRTLTLPSPYVHLSECSYDQEFVDTLRYALEKNMTIGSHTATHPHLRESTDDEIRWQIKQTNLFLKRTLGISPKFIRIPYGETDDRIEKIVKDEFKMQTIWWNVDTEDSSGASPQKVIDSFKHLRRNSQDIVIMHDVRENYTTKDGTLETILKCEKCGDWLQLRE